MKKSIFAVLAVTAMGASHAQTPDTSSVSLYGVIDEGYLSKQENKSENNGVTTKKISSSITGFQPGNTSATFIGIRTKENLGNGVDAKATIEFGFTPAHGENTEGKSHAAIRQAHVGLYSSGFGNLTIGRLQNKTFDFLASEGLGSGNLPGTILSKRVQELDRINGIRYSIGNEIITGYVSYGQNNEKTTTTEGTEKTNASSGYHQFELAVEGKYQGAFGKVAFIKGDGIKYNVTRIEEGFIANGNNFQINISENLALSAQTLLANVGYDFGIIKPSYTFLQNKVSGGYHDTKYIKQTFHQLGFTAPVTSAINLYGSYYIKNADGIACDDTVHSGAALSAKNGNGWQIGTTYHFSKRTNLYAAYGQESINYKYSKEGYIDVNGKIDNKAYTIGLKHLF